MFASLSDRLTATFKNLRGKGKLSASDIEATIRDIRRALLEADVATSVARTFAKRIQERALGEEVSQALNPAQHVVKIVNEELIEILGGQSRELQFSKTPPTVIMLAGLQGAGKTTFAGKLAHWLRQNGQTPVLAACDLQRPNAVTQLQIVGDGAGVPVFAPHPGASAEGELLVDRPADPVAVARDAVEFAREKMHSVLIVDTAGRLGIDEELMQQAADIRAAISPDEVLFVIDAMIGQDAAATAQAFNEGVDLTGVVLSKLDGDARGGAALSVATVTGKPIMFASVGEKVTDLEQFHPDRMASRILDMGDVLTLIEQAEKAFDAEEAEKMATKFVAGDDFTLTDFLTQMQAVRKMGSLKKMLGMLPGMGEMREQIENFDEREIDRIEAIVKSMTPGERELPRIINGSRRSRIAKGSGTTVTEVNQLLERFTEAQKMMKQMAKGGGMPGMPGMGGMPGGMGLPGGGPGRGGGKRKKGKKGGGKSKSGNPAKRAAQQRREPQSPKPSGSAFGNASGAPGGTPDAEALRKMFGQQ